MLVAGGVALGSESAHGASSELWVAPTANPAMVRAPTYVPGWPSSTDRPSVALQAKKDPNAPKGPLSAYFQFMQEQRPLFKKQNPDTAVTEVAKALGEKWKSMSPAAKKPYQVLYEEDKARYEEEMKSYNPPPADPSAPKAKKGKKVKDPNAPKKPLSAYLLFSADARAKMKQDSVSRTAVETVQEIARLWKSATPAVKSKYEKAAADGKVAYERALAAYTGAPVQEAAPKPAAPAPKKAAAAPAPKKQAAAAPEPKKEKKDKKEDDEDKDDDDDTPSSGGDTFKKAFGDQPPQDNEPRPYKPKVFKWPWQMGIALSAATAATALVAAAKGAFGRRPEPVLEF